MKSALRSVALKARRGLLASPVRDQRALAAAAKGPLVVAGLFGTGSGIGESARSCADALADAGLRPRRVDLSSTLGQVDLAFSGEAFPRDRRGTLLLHLNPPEVDAALMHLGFWGPRAWRVVGCWVWELETAPASWMTAVRRVSEVWAPSAFCADAFDSFVDVPVRVAPYRIVPPPALAPATGLVPEGAFCVLAMADGRSSFTRKNIEAAVAAFQQGLGSREGAWLIVKTRNANESPEAYSRLKVAACGHPRIVFLDTSLDALGRWRLLARADVLLSLHRSEGFGLTIAEAMAMGKPVVATDWSATAEFLDADVGFPVPYSFASVVDPDGVYVDLTQSRWADPDISAASLALGRLAEDAALRTKIGAAARTKIARLFDGRSYLRALLGA